MLTEQQQQRKGLTMRTYEVYIRELDGSERYFKTDSEESAMWLFKRLTRSDVLDVSIFFHEEP